MKHRSIMAVCRLSIVIFLQCLFSHSSCQQHMGTWQSYSLLFYFQKHLRTLCSLLFLSQHAYMHVVWLLPVFKMNVNHASSGLSRTHVCIIKTKYLTTEAAAKLVTSRIPSRLDYCNALLSDLPASCVERLIFSTYKTLLLAKVSRRNRLFTAPPLPLPLLSHNEYSIR